MIQEMYKSYFISASLLGDFQSMTKTELANGYCDADDAKDFSKRDQYYSALMLRYWYKIYDFYNESKSAKLELEEFASWVSESLDVGLKYRRWRDQSNPLSKDPNAPDKVFNRCFFSTRKRWYTYFNKDKRKLNYTPSNSIEDWFNDDNMASPADFEEISNIWLYSTGNYTEIELESPSYSVVQHYLNKGKVLEAIIVDSIAHQDSFNTKTLKRKKKIFNEEGKEIKVGEKVTEFSDRKIIKQLNNLDDGYLKYFQQTYNVSRSKLKDAVKQISKISNTKLYNYVSSTLSELRDNEDIIKILKGIN